MSSTKKLSLPLSLLLAGLFIGVSGCSWGAASRAEADSVSARKPDRVQIAVEKADSVQGKPVMMVTDVKKVQQLYAQIHALSPMPEQQVCTMELGPHYTLKFYQGNNLLATVSAKREGCQPVSIAGEKQERQATKAFWTMLDGTLNA